MAEAIGNRQDGSTPAGRQWPCKHCGACCVNVGRPPFRPDDTVRPPPEIQRLVAWLDERDPQRAAHITPCYFFNLATRKCLIYEHRPQACREFLPGGQLCLELRRAFVPCMDKFNDDMKNRH
ncbi:MAG: YkgJ family cysteine cluster protein [Planctomycetota bacterium]|jgi:Fe-S-cluster containining protein